MESKSVIPPQENPNTTTVRRLYTALASGNTRIFSSIIATDLEWWFHGPQNCHHMMKILTGKSSPSDFKFVPRSMDAIGECVVVVEGWEGDRMYWVHVWTLEDGVITQFREYFNTWLMVKDLRPLKCSPRFTATILWQSHREDRSLPGLMLAI